MALRKRRPARGRGASLVQGLGTYGYARIERNFLAGLVLREPILLWGPHGAGKTELCRRAAEALGLRFWAYDASKSMFEDVIGFPDPSSLESGTVGYVRTPLSIWDKEAVLIDELNRAQPSLQSKWLEVVHARQIMGCPLPQLQQLFAAMNPPSYAGTNPLDEALAGRFIAILRIPELKDMSPEDARSVIRREREVPLAGPAAAAFLAAVEGARARLAAILPSVRAGAEEYVVEVVQAFQARDVAIDSRRAGMLRRLIEARLCVEEELLGQSIELATAGKVLYDGLSAGLPFEVSGQDVPVSVVRAAHELALALVTGSKLVRTLRLPSDPMRAVRAFEEQHREVPVEERRAGVTRLLGLPSANASTERCASAFVAVDQLARKVAAGELDLDPDDQFRILDARRRALAMGDEETRTIAEAVAEVDAEGRSSPELLVGLRAAANLLASHESDVPYSPPRGRRNGFASPVRQVRELGREIEERLTAGEEDAP